MPATPSLIATAKDGYVELAYSASDSPDYLRIYRSSVNENGGVPFAISPNLGSSGTFLDYNVASDDTYSYYVESTASGISAQSTVSQASIHLGYTWLHATYKKQTSGNLYGTALSVITLPPHNRDYSRPVEVFKYAGATKPEVRLSQIRKVKGSFNTLIQVSDDADRRTLREILELQMYCCLRDSLGNKYFGALTDVEESYSFHTDVPILLTQTAYSEIVPAGV